MQKNNPDATRVLVALPAFNEEATIVDVIGNVREALPAFDVLVVNDGSQDGTEERLKALNVVTATHLCNLGYGRAIQTAIKYALACDYEVLITLDSDGQHQPQQIKDMFRESMANNWDVLIGSRHIKERNYAHSPLGRRIGMQVFSTLVRLVTGRRVYDTTSGLKVLRRDVFEPLTRWHFVDFHAEAIVYLLRLGYRVGEFPITVAERTHGESMYSFLSHLKYPLKTSLMVLLGVLQANLTRRQQKP
jgi:glycosyltransferase involved in cell wall biosynthesis